MNNLVSGTQHQQILHSIIWPRLNNKQLVGGIFCDLHKALDCVNYDILLSKMEFYGTTGKANNLTKSYLEDRSKGIDRSWIKKPPK
jgi:hypothetical protein